MREADTFKETLTNTFQDHSIMSNWQNPSWQYAQPPSAANIPSARQGKLDQYSFASPSQPLQEQYSGTANKQAPSRPPETTSSPSNVARDGTKTARPGDRAALVGTPLHAEQPTREVGVSATSSGPMAVHSMHHTHIPYTQLPVRQLPSAHPAQGQQQSQAQPNQPPHEYGSYGNFQMPSEHWDQFALGVRHPQPGQVDSRHTASFNKAGPKELPGGGSPLESESGRNVEPSRSHSRKSSVGKVTKRSRMGCLTCRQRKKRCCETRPSCTECLRLRLNCVWPKPGTEHKNKPKEVKSQENMIEHDVYGKIKVLRGIVEYRND